MSLLLAGAALRTFYARLPQLRSLPLRLADDECAAADVLCFESLFVCQTFLLTSWNQEHFSARQLFCRFMLQRVCRTAAYILSAALLWPQQAVPARESSPFESIPELTSDLAHITGLKPLKKVQYDMMNREDLKRFLDRRVKEELKPEEVRIEELSLKKLGLVPQDFQLASTMVDLMAEQAEAFYDYRRKKLFLVEGENDASPIQKAALLHELAHALADQHFQLEKFIRRGKTDDSALARAAVMEGQATWIMYEWMASKAGQSLRKTPALSAMVGSRSAAMTSQYPVLGSAPLYVRASLLFPYTEGMRFQQAVVEKMGEAGFAEVFRNPPLNSQQILHPDKYFEHVIPVEAKLPVVARHEDYKQLLEATIGEFDHSVMLEQYGGRQIADELAPKWRGGALRLLENKKDKHVVLLYASEWATPGDARKMFDAYKTILKGKWKTLSYVKQTDDLLEGNGDDGSFRVRLEGSRLTSVEGLRTAEETGVSSRS